jgi:hypothetical protein
MALSPNHEMAVMMIEARGQSIGDLKRKRRAERMLKARHFKMLTHDGTVANLQHQTFVLHPI